MSGEEGLTRISAEAFYGGLAKFEEYIEACAASPAKFQGTELVAILHELGSTLQTHLAHEPAKLAGLSQYDIDMASISAKTADHSMKRTSTTDVLPLLWYNLDKEFEGGKWASFPELPAPLKWVMINLFGWWHSNWWRFGSSGPDGLQRDLLCLTKAYDAAT